MKIDLKKICFLVVTMFLLIGGIYWRLHNKVTFSVVIPVYNAEKYLVKCLDSIFAQKGDFEVIAVNDGSTDNSLKILQEYAKKHKNLKIINQRNQGIATARNNGMHAATKKYVTFVDNDDWLEANTFELAEETIQQDKPDILLTGYADIYDREWVRNTRGEEDAQKVPEINRFVNRGLDKLSLFSPFFSKEAHADLYNDGGGVRARFYLKSFLDSHNIYFEDMFGEDIFFAFRAYAYNPLISVLNVPVYNYLNRVDATSKSEKVINSIAKSMEKLRQIPEYKTATRREQMLMDDYWLAMYLVGFSNLERHGISLQSGYAPAYQALQSFSIYNEKELKSARNYQKLRNLLQNNTH